MSMNAVLQHQRRERDTARCEVLDGERASQSARLTLESARRKREAVASAGASTSEPVSVGALQLHQQELQNWDMRCQELQAMAAQTAASLQAAQSRLRNCEQRLRALEQLEQRRLEREQRDQQRIAKRAWEHLVMSAGISTRTG